MTRCSSCGTTVDAGSAVRDVVHVQPRMSNSDTAFSDGGTDGLHQRPQSMFDYEAEWRGSNSMAAPVHRELPLGDPRAGLGAAPPVLDGWQISGVTSKQSGRPFSIFTGVDSSGDANTGSDRRTSTRPAASCGRRPQELHEQRLLCRAARQQRSAAGQQPRRRATRRETARGTRHRPGSTDLSLMKRVSFGSTQVRRRVDAFNVFNQDDYGGARGTTISARPRSTT